MSDDKAQEFINATGTDRYTASKYLQRNFNDVRKAIEEYQNENKPTPIQGRPKETQWYAGGSKSGIAMLAPGTVDPNESVPYQPKQLPESQPQFQGNSHSLGGGVSTQTANTPQPSISTDLTTPGEAVWRVRLEIPGQPPKVITVSPSTTVGKIREFAAAFTGLGADVSLTNTADHRILEDNNATAQSESLRMASLRVGN